MTLIASSGSNPLLLIYRWRY